jgi:hypothetical protein
LYALWKNNTRSPDDQHSTVNKDKGHKRSKKSSGMAFDGFNELTQLAVLNREIQQERACRNDERVDGTSTGLSSFLGGLVALFIIVFMVPGYGLHFCLQSTAYSAKSLIYTPKARLKETRKRPLASILRFLYQCVSGRQNCCAFFIWG